MLRIQMEKVLRAPIGSERTWGEVGAEKLPRPELQEFSLSSESFEDGGIIPERLTGEEGVSLQLSWMNEPKGTQYFVIIMDDPDAQPAMGHSFVHWVAMLPTSHHSLVEGASTGGWTDGRRVLAGDRTSIAYKGPKPPSGTHRYYIALYAMSRSFRDPEFQDLAGSELANDTHTYTRERFESLHRSDINAKAEITGTYSAKHPASH